MLYGREPIMRNIILTLFTLSDDFHYVRFSFISTEKWLQRPKWINDKKRDNYFDVAITTINVNQTNYNVIDFQSNKI